MKKRVALAITLSLLLAISTIAVLAASNTNQPPTLLNSNPNNLRTITKPYTGSGDPLNALLYITNVYNNVPNGTNTSSDIYIPCPDGWKIIWANLTLTDINAPNATIEPNPNPFSGDTEITLLAMSFRLTSNAYLDNVSVYLRAPGGGSIAHFYVYDAIESGGVPIPNNLIKNISSVSIPAGNPIWFDLSFGHQFLNTSSTYNNTFFIGIENIDTSKFYWKHVTPASGGYAYKYQSGVWSPLGVDFKLKVNVSASELAPAESAWPSDVGLTINGSRVSDVSKGNGEWINTSASPVSTGYIFFDVDSTWMSAVSFSYIWNVTYARDTYISATTNFVVSPDSGALWNITVDAADAFPKTDGVNHINITGIPPDWGDTSSMAYNQSGDSWVALDSHPPETISFPASNGTWIVNCTAPNYVSNIGFTVDGETVENATLCDALNITVAFDAPVTGTVNLSIYDPSQNLNHTDEILVSSVASTWFIWNVGDTANNYGTYNVTVGFKNGFVVGYNETSLDVVPLWSTSLTVTSYPPEVEYPGPIPIVLYYSRTDTGQGLPGAVIAAYFVNGTPATIPGSVNDYGNGSYSFGLDFGTDFGVHSVYFNASGLRLFEVGVSSPVQINYTRISVTITIGFEVDGEPVENATLDDLLNITVSFDEPVSGSVALRIYDPFQKLNYTDTKILSGVNSVVFGWNVGSTASSDGIFNVTVSFVGGVSAGYNETSLKVVPLIVTGLVVTNFPANVEYPNTVPITLYYYDDNTGLGLAGATIVAYEGGKVLPIYNRIDYGNGTYSFILDFGTDFGVHEVRFVASGVRFYASSVSETITINFKAPYYVVVNPEVTGLILLMSNMLSEQNQKIVRYLVLGAVVGSVVVGGVVASRVRRRHLVPLRAMASLENIIVDHIPSGVTLWAFDFYRMEQDASLVSGFMSAVKTFLAEMRKGGLRKLETEFGTFIREDGNILTATCITSGVTVEEEKWIRGKLREFVSRAEEQNWEKLVDWKGEVSQFKASLLEILSSLIDLDKAEALQREKIMKLLREREKLQEELNILGSKLQKLNQEYREGKISEMDFAARKAQIEPKYDKVQMDYIRASIILSKAPYTIESMWEVAQDKEGVETIRDRFIEIRMQIDELQKKEQEGAITAKELKRKEKLKKELMSLIEKLDKRRVK
ncbi:MAG: hypothetical protein QW261_04885 [Candidatus Jordarchaeaceae archaeon]